MSRENANLQALLREARAETPRGRWNAQGRLFRRLSLGSAPALFLARIAHAFGARPALSYGVAGVVGVATIVGIYGVTRLENHPPPVPLVAIAPTVRDIDPLPAPKPEDAIPSVSVNALPTVAEAKPTAAPIEVDPLAGETASVRRIRAALAAGDPNGALAAARAHRSQFPSCILCQEVAVLEIDAHHELGHDDLACELGRAFLNAYPTSAHRTRVAGIVRSCEP